MAEEKGGGDAAANELGFSILELHGDKFIARNMFDLLLEMDLPVSGAAFSSSSSSLMRDFRTSKNLDPLPTLTVVCPRSPFRPQARQGSGHAESTTSFWRPLVAQFRRAPSHLLLSRHDNDRHRRTRLQYVSFCFLFGIEIGPCMCVCLWVPLSKTCVSHLRSDTNISPHLLHSSLQIYGTQSLGGRAARERRSKAALCRR